ncbi:MAG: hypothetical protein ACR2NP_04330 [Pirellulaceae bacterium]
MNELLKTLRLGFYVCALPLVATAIASAHSWINVDDDSLATQLDQMEAIQVVPAGVGEVIADVNPHVKHNLRIDQSGGVSGQILTRGGSDIYGTPDLSVSLNYRGDAVATSTTDQNGQFHFENVTPGAYTFIASSPTSITTFGVYVYADEALQPAPNEFQLSVAAAGSNVTGVREMLNSEVEAVAYSYTPNEAELPVFDELMQVDRNSDGSLSGRVVPLQWLESQTRFNLTGNYVYLFDASGMAAQVPVDANGNYRIENVTPGIYDFVSFGPHGAAAMSIQVTGLESVTSTSTITEFVAASQQIVQDGFNTVLCEPPVGIGNEFPVEVDVIIPQQQQDCCGGAFGGYGGYGGGGYGGGGGFGGDWGGIIGAALGAWVLAEAFNNNNFNNGGGGGGVIVPPTVLPPVSPFF